MQREKVISCILMSTPWHFNLLSMNKFLFSNSLIILVKMRSGTDWEVMYLYAKRKGHILHINVNPVAF